MNAYADELCLTLLVASVLSTAYFFIYPRFAKDNITILALNDVAATLVCLVVAGYLYYDSDVVFHLFRFNVNWFWFTACVYLLLELPLGYLYVRKYIVK